MGVLLCGYITHHTSQAIHQHRPQQWQCGWADDDGQLRSYMYIFLFIFLYLHSILQLPHGGDDVQTVMTWMDTHRWQPHADDNNDNVAKCQAALAPMQMTMTMWPVGSQCPPMQTAMTTWSGGQSCPPHRWWSHTGSQCPHADDDNDDEAMQAANALTQTMVMVRPGGQLWGVVLCRL